MWEALLGVVGGLTSCGRLMRAGAPPNSAAASNQLLLPTPTTSCSRSRELDNSSSSRKMQQLVAFCIFGGFGLCFAVAELSRLFGASYISLTPSQFPSHQPPSLQAALCGLLEQAGDEGHRPKRCHGQPLSLRLRDVLILKVAQFFPLGQL